MYAVITFSKNNRPCSTNYHFYSIKSSHVIPNRFQFFSGEYFADDVPQAKLGSGEQEMRNSAEEVLEYSVQSFKKSLTLFDGHSNRS